MVNFFGPYQFLWYLSFDKFDEFDQNWTISILIKLYIWRNSRFDETNKITKTKAAEAEILSKQNVINKIKITQDN